MFRFWYSACRWSFVPFVLTAAILGASPLIRDIETPWITYPLAALLNLSIGSLIALGATGAVLGIWGCIWGIKSACPQCGASAPWEIPERNYLAINCEKCGLIGGHLLKDARSRFLREFYEESDEDPQRD